MIKYISLFSGIEAAKVAFDFAGIPAEPLAFFEIEKQQSKLLADKYPNTPNYGDVCEFNFSTFNGKIDFLCGGSPCQSFSMANHKRDFTGVDLMQEFVSAVWQCEPDYFLFENVPQTKSFFEEYVNENLFSEKRCLCEKYNIWHGVINSADFGFMQPRKRYYCIGSKKSKPQIKVSQVCKEEIEFNYLPPTNFDLKQFEKHKEEKRNGFTYSGQNWDKYAHTNRVGVLVKQHPVLEYTENHIGILSAETHEQLQGFPVGYTAGFSFTRRIAMLGNSWHCGTIAEIFKQVFNGTEFANNNYSSQTVSERGNL